MSADARAGTPVPPLAVSAELKALLCRLKLGRMLDTLPERLALAHTNRLPHHEFLELLLADEIARRGCPPRSPLVVASDRHVHLV